MIMLVNNALMLLTPIRMLIHMKGWISAGSHWKARRTTGIDFKMKNVQMIIQSISSHVRLVFYKTATYVYLQVNLRAVEPRDK